MVDDLEKLLSSKRIVRHLLRGSKTCQVAVEQGTGSLEAATQSKATGPKLNSSYDAAIDRVLAKLGPATSLPPDEWLRFQMATSLLESGGGVLALAKTGNMVAVEIAKDLDPEVYGPNRWQIFGPGLGVN
jgi:hypothetical protein